MLELPINQYNITEFKYKLSDTKTVTFKLNNFMLEDIEIEETDTESFKKNSITDKQYTIDRTIIDEHEAAKEKKVNDNFNKLKRMDKERCKELMDKLDNVPYKIYEKIGELYTNDDVNNAEGYFVTETDTYVVNDERERAKQKVPKSDKENIKTELEKSKKIISEDFIKEKNKALKEKLIREVEDERDAEE